MSQPLANQQLAGPLRSTIEAEVRYAETDQMGVVHHANYLVWFELARTRHCLASGHHYSDIEKAGFYLVVTGTRTRLLRSAHYGDTVTVSCWIERLRSRQLEFAYEVHRDSVLLATGSTEHVWVEIASGRPCRTPQMVAESFARLAQHEERPLASEK